MLPAFFQKNLCSGKIIHYQQSTHSNTDCGNQLLLPDLKLSNNKEIIFISFPELKSERIRAACDTHPKRIFLFRVAKPASPVALVVAIIGFAPPRWRGRTNKERREGKGRGYSVDPACVQVRVKVGGEAREHLGCPPLAYVVQCIVFSPPPFPLSWEIKALTRCLPPPPFQPRVTRQSLPIAIDPSAAIYSCA